MVRPPLNELVPWEQRARSRLGQRESAADRIVQLKDAGALGDADRGVAGKRGSAGRVISNEPAAELTSAGVSDPGSLEAERAEHFVPAIGIEGAAGDGDGSEVVDLVAARAAELSRAAVDDQPRPAADRMHTTGVALARMTVPLLTVTARLLCPCFRPT